MSILLLAIWCWHGERLFSDGTQPAGFTVTKPVSSSGVILATCERAGEIKTSSFAMENPTETNLSGGST